MECPQRCAQRQHPTARSETKRRGKKTKLPRRSAKQLFRQTPGRRSTRKDPTLSSRPSQPTFRTAMTLHHWPCAGRAAYCGTPPTARGFGPIGVHPQIYPPILVDNPMMRHAYDEGYSYRLRAGLALLGALVHHSVHGTCRVRAGRAVTQCICGALRAGGKSVSNNL